MKSQREDVPDVAEFFLDMNSNKKTAFISTCGDDTAGGCHGFTRSLAKEFKSDQVLTTYADYLAGLSEGKLVTFTPLNNQLQKDCDYKSVVVSGCCYNHLVDLLVDMEEKIGLDLSSLENIFIVTAPWFSTQDRNISGIIDSLEGSFENIKLLKSSINPTSTNNIGLPHPSIISTESDFKIDKDCFGLIYNNNLTFTDSKNNPSEYFSLYFAEVAKIAASQSIAPPTVIAIQVAPGAQQELLKLAGDKVKLKFTARLPAPDYSSALQQIGNKGGVIACNGAQTLVQNSIMGYQSLVHAVAPNHKFYQQMVDLLPSNLQSTAAVILGLQKNNDLLQDKMRMSEVYKEFQNIFKAATEKFNYNKLHYTNSVEIKPNQPDLPRARENESLGLLVSNSSSTFYKKDSEITPTVLQESKTTLDKNKNPNIKPS